MSSTTSKLQTKNYLSTSSNHHDRQHLNNDENWQYSTWLHRAWLALGCTTLLITLTKSISLTSTNSLSWLHTLFALVVGYLASDLASGIYHWAIDNYGGPQTLMLGSQIESFQSHHQQPWAITKRQFANNLYIPAATVTMAVMPINLFSDDPVLLGFVSVFAGCAMFCQQFHAWAHTPKGKLPAVVVALQDAGVVVARSQHAAHHRAPHDTNYCIVSGVWNSFLDWSRFFLGLEVVVFKVFGVQPRSWSDPKSDWTLGN